jgi:hypothetical protein
MLKMAWFPKRLQERFPSAGGTIGIIVRSVNYWGFVRIVRTLCPPTHFNSSFPQTTPVCKATTRCQGFACLLTYSCRYNFLQCSTDRAPVNFLLVLQIDSLPLTFFSPLLTTLCTQRPFTVNWVSIRKDAFCCPCLLLGGICIAKAQSCGWANSDQVSLKVSRYMRSTLSV